MKQPLGNIKRTKQVELERLRKEALAVGDTHMADIILQELVCRIGSTGRARGVENHYIGPSSIYDRRLLAVAGVQA